MGGRQLGRQLAMHPWLEILAMFFRNAFLELGPSIWHARLSLREAADVLRTDRRTRGEEKAAQVNANDGGMRPLTQHVNQTMYVT